MPVIPLKVGDTGPPIDIYATGADGAPMDLTGVLALRFRATRLGVTTIDGSAALYPGSDPTDGHLVYDLDALDTEADQVGWHECRFLVTDAAGRVTSVPNDDQEPLRIHLTAY